MFMTVMLKAWKYQNAYEAKGKKGIYNPPPGMAKHCWWGKLNSLNEQSLSH